MGIGSLSAIGSVYMPYTSRAVAIFAGHTLPYGMEQQLLTDEQAATTMAAFNQLDTEEGHGFADGLLCTLLKALGYSRTVEAFEKLPKWYA